MLIKNLNYYENLKLWKLAIQQNDIQLLRGLNSTGIIMTLSNDELINIIKSFKSVNYYETIAFLLDYILLNQYIVYGLLNNTFGYLKTPNSKKQQTNQLKIINNLIKYQIEKDVSNIYFNDIISTLNIPLVEFVIDKSNININELFNGQTVLIVVVNNVIHNRHINIKIEFAYETFDYLLLIGADANKRNYDFYDYIYLIKDQTIKQEFDLRIKKHFC